MLEWAGAEQARLQLQHAVFAGYSHLLEDGTPGDACFDLDVVGDVPLITGSTEPYVTNLLVSDGLGDFSGDLMLAVEDGLLAGVRLDWWTDEVPRAMPRPDLLWTQEKYDEWWGLHRSRAISGKRRRWLPRLRRR